MKKMKKTVILISSFLIINSLIIFSNIGLSENFTIDTLYVGGNGQSNYSSIQEAINASFNGDLIFVYSGIYNENIKINKSISLIGENKETTIINGNNGFNVITINASGVNISGFTIQKGLTLGIFIKDVGNLKIFKNKINANTIGILITTAYNLKIYNNTISNNSVTGINITCNFTKTPSENNTFNCYNISIFHNNFINNTQNGYDKGNSSWSFNNEGNFYDDYKALDKNNDGIGDKPYILSDKISVDKYPLMMPYNGKIRIKEFYVDEGLLYEMLVISMIIAIIFILPIGYIWYKKHYKKNRK